MKVLMAHKTYKGGVVVYVRGVSEKLRKKGFKVKEITRNEDLGSKTFFSSLLQMKKLFKKWGKEYDIIHTHDWSITYPAIKAGIKNLVATFHAFPTNPIAKIFEGYCIKTLGRNAIVISPKMKRLYKNSTYIPNGVNLSIFKKYTNIRRGENLVGLAQKYNLEKITHLLRELNLRYIYTGGRWKYRDLSKFYSMINIFISIPYKQAGFNLVWLEAMACEVPYIIGTNDGIGEILPIYKVSSFDELKDILTKIMDKKIKPLKNQRKWIIKNNLTWENHVKKLVKVYESVIR